MHLDIIHLFLFPFSKFHQLILLKYADWRWIFVDSKMQAEVDFLGKLSHPNLVKLLGYCLEDQELLLVYEFMAKGSLENHLFRSKNVVLRLRE